ncbi:MAG: thioredoxin domain-containing protein [Candidatus Micrarchaeota archaeon]
MVLCIIAFFVFSAMSIFSAKYRPLARKGFECVFRTVTLRPCDTGLDDQIKADIVSGLLKHSPPLAKAVNRHFVLLSWAFVILTLGSFAYAAIGVYNFYVFGNCDGPDAAGACILNDLTGDYGRFSEPKDLVPPTGLDGMSAGNPNASVVIVEFGCFTCPYTGKAEGTMDQILSEYNGSVYYVFKPFPLPNHNYSFEAARAVLCARDQGKQDELRDSIFAQQEVCAADGHLAIKTLAQKAGLDMARFNDCYDNNRTDAELERYVQQGKDSHIYATPTFFINGKPIVGPRPIEEFRAAIGEAMGGG